VDSAHRVLLVARSALVDRAHLSLLVIQLTPVDRAHPWDPGQEGVSPVLPRVR
jgi:hypothetical protein